MKVFISGSRSIKKFNEDIEKELFNELNYSSHILVGDANGVDDIVQQFCASRRYKNLTVYAMNKPRNNRGNFQTKIFSSNRKGRGFYTEKDIIMTNNADFGIVIWDGKSKGSLDNIDRLIKQNKICKVYSMESQKWFMVESKNCLKNSEKNVVQKSLFL